HRVRRTDRQQDRIVGALGQQFSHRQFPRPQSGRRRASSMLRGGRHLRCARPAPGARGAAGGRSRTQDRRPWQAGAVPAPKGFRRHLDRAGAGRTIPGFIHYVVLFSFYAVCWFLVLFCLLPIGLGEVDAETGAPLKANFGKKALWATGVAAVLWLVFYFSIGFGWLAV